MTQQHIVAILVACLVLLGCSADIPRIKTELRKGMTRDEVTRVLGTRGELKKEDAGFSWKCAKGHAWHPATLPGNQPSCPVCGTTGHADKERWYLFRRSQREWGAVYLAMTFDGDGRLEDWAVGDM